MIRNSTFDEMIRPEDVLEEVEIEIAPDAFEGPVTCAECGHAPERVISTTALRGGKILVEFEQYRCPHCGWERMTLEQARQLQIITHFFTDLYAETAVPPGAVLARVRPLTESDFLVRVG